MYQEIAEACFVNRVQGLLLTWAIPGKCALLRTLLMPPMSEDNGIMVDYDLPS